MHTDTQYARIIEAHAKAAFRTGETATPGIIERAIAAATDEIRSRLIAAEDEISRLNRELERRDAYIRGLEWMLADIPSEAIGVGSSL